MKTFEYRGFDQGGRAARGLIEALSVKDAREKLAGGGILAERVNVTGRKLKVPVSVRSNLYRELSVLLASGLPLVRALDVMIESPELGDQRLVLAGVRDRVKEGASLGASLSEVSGSVSAFERAIIEVAERSATVEKMLERLAAFLEDQERLRDRIQNALIYPMIIVTIGIVMAVLMLGLLIPRTQHMLTESGVELPGLTAFMMGVGKFLGQFWVPLLLIVMGAVCYIRVRLKRDEQWREKWDRAMFRMPIIGRGYRLLVNLRFARTFAILLHGGVSLMEGLVLSGRGTGSVWITRLTTEESESIRHGDSLSEATRRIPPLAGTMPSMIHIGEVSGGLERLLSSAADRYQQMWDRYVSRCLSLLEPVLILVIGVFVLLVALSVLLPILSMSRTLGG